MSGISASTERQAHDAPRAHVLVCADGVLLPNKSSTLFRPTADWRKYGGQLVSGRDGLLLPNCRTSDILLAQPRLGITLNDDAVSAAVRAEQQGILAATILGPPQEKTRNEDF